jgi:hypothetical protein
LAQSNGLLDLLYKSGLERSVDTYIVGSNEISNILIGKKDLNPSGRNSVPTKPAYSAKNPYNVGLNIINERVINIDVPHSIWSTISTIATPPTYITSGQALAISIFNDTLEVYNILQTYATYASANAFALVVDP